MNSNYDMTVMSENGEEKKYSVNVVGLFMYKENKCAFDSVNAFVKEYANNKHDFNECYGTYRLSMQQNNGEKVFFSDNSGMMRFYINTDNNHFYHSLREAQPYEKRKPNYSSIAQFLNYGCDYNGATIVESVVLSDPNFYYVLNNEQIQKKSKELKTLQDYEKNKVSLNSLVIKALSHCEGKKGCTITGGIDSRSVLSNLLSVNARPELAITGNEKHPDVEIAQEISSMVGLNLNIVSDDIEEEEWLDYAVDAADGQDGICEIYRLDKLARFLNKNDIALQFGGVAGEMYKNSFINQDFPIYFGRPKWYRFYKYKVGTYEFDRVLFTDKMLSYLDKLPENIVNWLKTHTGENKADAYLNAGYEIMQARCNHVINMFERYTTVYNPLMERRMAAYAFGENPYKLEMQAFQRSEVSRHCKKMQNIKTDRGLTCNYNRRAIEFIKSYLFLVRVALQRLLFRKKEDMRIDNCFITGHKNESFINALEKTKTLGIINKDIEIEKIPIGLADRLFTIGLFFDTVDEKS